MTNREVYEKINAVKDIVREVNFDLARFKSDLYKTGKITDTINEEKESLWEAIEDSNLKKQEEIEENLSEDEPNEAFLDTLFEKVKLTDSPPPQVKFGLHSDTLHAVNDKKLRMVSCQ